MTRIVQSLHLSDIQKEFLAKVKAAPNAHMAYSTIASTEGEIGQNFANARDTLAKLGIVEVRDGEIEIINDQILADEGLTDESGELTEFGQQLAYIDRREIKDQQQQPQQQDAAGGEDLGMDMGEEELPMESLSLFRKINDQAELLEQINRFKK